MDRVVRSFSLRPIIRKRRSSRGVVFLEAPEPSERRVRCSSSHVLQAATTLATLRSIRPEIWRKEKPHSRRPIMRPRANCVN
jgi:hypothetical protein